jgi:hemolysin activation/secretion protein
MGDQIILDAIGSQGAIYGSVKYWMPVSNDGWRVGLGGSQLGYYGLESFSATPTNGNASTYGVYASYALERHGSESQNLSFGLENRDYQNFVRGLEASKYSITSVNMGWSGTKMWDKSNLNYSVTGTIGNLFIRNSQQLISDQSPTGPFTAGTYEKLNVYLGYLSPLPVETTNLLISVNAQVASRNLNSSEQLYIGGPYGVRAYPIAQGGGAHGLVTSAEVIHTYPNQLQLSVFFDMGIVQQYVSQWSSTLQGLTGADNAYAVYAAGFGAKYNFNNFQLQGTLAFRVGQNPLLNADGAQLNTDNQYRTVQAWIRGNYFF